MIEKIDTNQIQELPGKSSPKQPDPARAFTDNGADVSLQVDYASFINKATQIPQTDTNAVQRAQELLLSGRLESPENIQAAAENIAEFGI
jgi:hypothetical protein